MQKRRERCEQAFGDQAPGCEAVEMEAVAREASMRARREHKPSPKVSFEEV